MHFSLYLTFLFTLFFFAFLNKRSTAYHFLTHDEVLEFWNVCREKCILEFAFAKHQFEQLQICMSRVSHTVYDEFKARRAPFKSFKIMNQTMESAFQRTCSGITPIMNFESAILKLNVLPGKKKQPFQAWISDAYSLTTKSMDLNLVQWHAIDLDPMCDNEECTELSIHSKQHPSTSTWMKSFERYLKFEFDQDVQGQPLFCLIVKQSVNLWRNEISDGGEVYTAPSELLNKVFLNGVSLDLDSKESISAHLTEEKENTFGLHLTVLPRTLPESDALDQQQIFCYFALDHTLTFQQLSYDTLQSMVLNPLHGHNLLQFKTLLQRETFHDPHPNFVSLLCMSKNNQHTLIQLQLDRMENIDPDTTDSGMLIRVSVVQPSSVQEPSKMYHSANCDLPHNVTKSIFPEATPPQYFLSNFTVNHRTLLSQFTPSQFFTIDYHWDLSSFETDEFSLPFQLFFKPNAKHNFALFVMTQLLPSTLDHDAKNTDQELSPLVFNLGKSRSFACYDTSCLAYTFKKNKLAGVKYVQDLYAKVLHVRFLFFQGAFKSTWSIRVHPKLNPSLILQRIQSHPSSLFQIFRSIHFNGQTLNGTHVKQLNSLHNGRLVDLVYDTPRFFFEFVVKPEHVKDVNSTEFTIMIGLNEHDDSRYKHTIVKAPFLVEKGQYVIPIFSHHFNGWHHCNDWNNKEFKIGIFFKSLQRGFLSGAFRVQFKIPFYMMSVSCSLPTSTQVIGNELLSVSELQRQEKLDRDMLVRSFLTRYHSRSLTQRLLIPANSTTASTNPPTNQGMGSFHDFEVNEVELEHKCHDLNWTLHSPLIRNYQHHSIPYVYSGVDSKSSLASDQTPMDVNSLHLLFQACSYVLNPLSNHSILNDLVFTNRTEKLPEIKETSIHLPTVSSLNKTKYFQTQVKAIHSTFRRLTNFMSKLHGFQVFSSEQELQFFNMYERLEQVMSEFSDLRHQFEASKEVVGSLNENKSTLIEIDTVN